MLLVGVVPVDRALGVVARPAEFDAVVRESSCGMKPAKNASVNAENIPMYVASTDPCDAESAASAAAWADVRGHPLVTLLCVLGRCASRAGDSAFGVAIQSTSCSSVVRPGARLAPGSTACTCRMFCSTSCLVSECSPVMSQQVRPTSLKEVYWLLRQAMESCVFSLLIWLA